MSNTSNTRLSTASSCSKNKAKKDDFLFYDSSASDQVRKDPFLRFPSIRGDELEDEDFGFSPPVSHTRDREHQLEGSVSRKPATTTRQTPVKKKTKPQSARNTEKATTANPPSGKKRGTKKAKRPSTETGDSTEPAAKRPRVASEHVDKDNHSRVETKKSEAKNDEAHGMTLKTADKSKERKYRFLSSSESEVEDEVEDEVWDEEDDKVEDEDDDEDDNIFLSRQKTKSHKISLPGIPLIRPSTCLIRPANEKSSEETPLSKRRRFSDSSKKQSPTKRLQSPVKSSQQLNDLENDIYAHGDDPGLIEVLKRPMLRSANSTNQAPLISAIDLSTLPVPNRSHLPTQFNLYLASPGDPVRVMQLSNAEHSLSLVYIQPEVVHALKINNPIMVVQIKGSVEFRSNPHFPSCILLNSSTRLVDLKAGILHVVNTGEEEARFLLIEPAI